MITAYRSKGSAKAFMLSLPDAARRVMLVLYFLVISAPSAPVFAFKTSISSDDIIPSNTRENLPLSS